MVSSEKIIPGIVVCIIGLFFLIFGYFKFVKPVYLKVQNSAVTSAKITPDEVKSGYATGNSLMVEYTVSSNGEVYKESVSQRGRIMRLKENERVTVYYDSNRPDEVMLADTTVLYRDAMPLALFAFPILLFGISLLALGILNRDSFFDISHLLKNGLPASVKTSSKIISGLCVMLLIMKLYYDIPFCINTTPYLFISILIFVILNIASFLVLLKLNQK
ncbi:MAG TPA: DUF3592 domain-containing protein [Spirochaetota bacterium]|nr:DUF3592 domain-containing protein [Spirochaetota bacterium]